MRSDPILLLDTCAAIWLAEGKKIAAQAKIKLEAAATGSLYVSPISAWEIGLLVARSRLTLLVTPERWFARMLASPSIRLADMPPEVLISASFLPGKPPKDLADRIIAATARDLGATLLTRDRLLLAYAEQGHLSAVAC